MRAAAARYGIPLADWLDLSTGINPTGWPVPAVPARVWNRLPEHEDGLERAAADYYGAPAPLPLAGSQAAIQVLPLLRPPGRVGVPDVGYQEHAYAWRSAGHEVVRLEHGDPGRVLDSGDKALDCLVVINPNNPTGRCWPAEVLLDWHARLAARGGWLVVDEAFMDAAPGASVLPESHRPGLVVLRSLGKFFGLAGARVGFLFADAAMKEQVERRLGPWTLAGPSRWIAMQALADRGWQAAARADLLVRSARLARLLAAQGLPPTGGTALFQWIRTRSAAHIHGVLARQGVLTRHFEAPQSLRFGLPGHEKDWARLAAALSVAHAACASEAPGSTLLS